MSGSVNTFHPADYALFGASLALSAGVGVFYAIKDRKKTDTEEMLLGGRNMSVIPVALSLLASFQSAISIVGVPAETYYFDTMFLWFGLSAIPMTVMACYIYVPIFYNLKITSSYEVSYRPERVILCSNIIKQDRRSDAGVVGGKCTQVTGKKKKRHPVN